MGIVTRLALDRDAEGIRGIYNPEVLHSTVTFDLVPRTLEDQLRWIGEHRGAHPALVAVDDTVEDGDLLGFGSLSPWRSRPAYATSVENSVYVSPEHRGAGVGGVLLWALIDTAGELGFHTVFARIVGGHQSSIALHAGCGFEMVGVEREVGRKFGRWLDVVVMQRLL